MGSVPCTRLRVQGRLRAPVVLAPRQWRAMRAWLGKPEAFADPYFETFVARLENVDVLMALYTGTSAR